MSSSRLEALRVIRDNAAQVAMGRSEAKPEKIASMIEGLAQVLIHMETEQDWAPVVKEKR